MGLLGDAGRGATPGAGAPPDEADLIRRARRGEGTAWEDLVRRHQEPVFRFAYLQLGDADEAEDAAQETFIRASQALDRFDLARPLRPWLLRIAANLARNRRRSLGRYLAALRRLAPPEAGAAGRLVEESSTRRLEAEALWQAVRRLNPTEQQVIYLRYFLNLSIEELAQAMEVAPGTIKSRLHRALGRLREVIGREFPGLVEALAPGSGASDEQGNKDEGLNER